MNYKNSLTSLAMFMVALNASAQSQTVTGKVVDSDGMEVIGATIKIKGDKSVGAVSDMDGKFTINTKNAAKDIIIVSYMGMKPQEVKVNGRKQLDVKLEQDAITTDDVVVIGYAPVRRKDLTGSVSSIKSDELLKVPTNDISQALAGRISGLQVESADGAPGSKISIRVRGGISISQSNDPLYVIDGFATEDGLSNLDPASIETIDVLKDASATAIYGARGANGVIVVTTKQGSTNKATVSFDTYIGWRKIANKLDVLSTEEFVLADYERTLGNLTGDATMNTWISRYGNFADIHTNYANRKGIDWQDETLGRTTFVQNYRVSVQGGSKDTQYSAAYSFFKDEGAMVYSGDKKHDITFNLKSNLSKRLTFAMRGNIDVRKITGAGTAGDGTGNYDARFNKMTSILQSRPTAGMMGADETLLDGEDPILADMNGNVMQNPLINAREETVERESRTFSINGELAYKIMKGLTWRTVVGYRYYSRRNAYFYGEEHINSLRNGGPSGSINNNENEQFQISNTLSYNKSWQKKHNLTVLLGQEYVNRSARSVTAAATGFPDDGIGLGDLSLGTASSVQSSQNYDDKLCSFFGRLNYNYRDLYLVSASLRADGSSKFGKDNKWGYFPAVSAAWRAGEEKFIKDLNIFSDLKFRIGYGLAGNNRIGSYNSLAILQSVYTAVGNGVGAGYASKQIPNPDLKWEANKTFNFGIDLGFFNQRLTLAPEFYINKSSNLLLNANLPYSSGYTAMILNAGRTKNTGIDLAINSVNIDNSHLTWRTAITLSHNKNTVEALTGESEQLYEARFGFNQNTHRVAVGEELGQFYGYKTAGIYTMDDFTKNEDGTYGTLKDGVPYLGKKELVKPGMWKFEDFDNDGEITEKDKRVIGNANPTIYGGINNTFNIGNFDFSIYFTYSIGAELLNATKLINSKVGSTNRNSLDVMNSHNRWMTINANGEITRDYDELAAINQGKTVAAYYDCTDGNYYIHSWAVEDASYLRLSNVTLGYTFPMRMLRKVGIRKLRLYATANNLFTVTGYSGYDPSVSTMSSALTPGVDYGAYPRSRSFIFGLNLSF